jgi:hypothetical protein
MTLGSQGCGWLFDDGDDGDGSGSPVDDPTQPPPSGPDPVTEAPFEDECVPSEWLPDPAAQWGTPVSLALRGDQVRVDADTVPVVEDIHAPLRIEPVDPELPIVAFGDARVDGLHEGTLVVVGVGIVATGGRMVVAANGELELDDARAWVRPWADAEDDGMRPQLGEGAAATHQASIDGSASYGLAIEALELSAFDEAYVVTEGGTVPLTAPITVSATRVFWGEGSRVGASAVSARYTGEVFIGIAAVEGELVDAGVATDELPLAILARDARLDVGPDHVRSLEDVPVRQALGVDEALVASTVLLRSCQADTLVMYAGQTRRLQLAYHQSGAPTDAVFADAWVEDEAGNMLSARIELSANVPESLQVAADRHPDAAWGQGIIDFMEGWAEVTEAVVEGLRCVFTLGFVCPHDGPAPDALAPYPAWMEPAAAGAFELELTAPLEPGTHELRVQVVGQNYTTTLPLHVLVQ